MRKDFFEAHPLAKQLLYMLGVSVVIIILAFLFIKIIARQGKEYKLPDFVGTTLQEAKDSNNLHLKFVVIDSVYDPETKGGIILQQDPKPGTMIKTRRKIYITVTTFAPTDVILPELSNVSVRSAVSSLEAAGLQCGRLTFVESQYNVVLSSSYKGKLVYAGEQMQSGAKVDLTVGMGEGNRGTRVPFVIGQVVAKARKGILAASLNVGQEHFDGVTDRSRAVCYRISPDYTGITRYPLGTYVSLWYCDASDADVQRIVNNFQVDSSQIIETDEDEFNYEEEDNTSASSSSSDDGWDW